MTRDSLRVGLGLGIDSMKLGCLPNERACFAAGYALSAHLDNEVPRPHAVSLRAKALMTAAFTNPAGGAPDEARRLLAQAVELDPRYAPALALAGYFEAKSVALRPPCG